MKAAKCKKGQTHPTASFRPFSSNDVQPMQTSAAAATGCLNMWYGFIFTRERQKWIAGLHSVGSNLTLSVCLSVPQSHGGLCVWIWPPWMSPFWFWLTQEDSGRHIKTQCLLLLQHIHTSGKVKHKHSHTQTPASQNWMWFTPRGKLEWCFRRWFDFRLKPKSSTLHAGPVLLMNAEVFPRPSQKAAVKWHWTFVSTLRSHGSLRWLDKVLFTGSTRLFLTRLMRWETVGGSRNRKWSQFTVALEMTDAANAAFWSIAAVPSIPAGRQPDRLMWFSWC